MKITKAKVSFTIDPRLLHQLDQAAEAGKTSKSALMEKALKILMEKLLEEDAKKIAKMKFDDLPTEKEWASIEPNDEWVWNE